MLTHLHEVTDTSIFDTCELVGLTRARYTGESSGRFLRSTQALAPVWINGIKLSAESPGSYSIFLNVLQVTMFMTAVGLRTNRLEQWLSNSHPRQMPPLNPAAVAFIDSKSGAPGWIPRVAFSRSFPCITADLGATLQSHCHREWKIDPAKILPSAEISRLACLTALPRGVSVPL